MNIKLLKFCTALKSNYLKQESFFSFSHSKIIENLCEILYREGIIQSYVLTDKKNDLRITIFLRYSIDKSTSKRLKLVSRPSNKKYLTIEEIKRLKLKTNTLILSTSLGLMTLEDCLRNKVGGIALFLC